jgi:hypothetical protein
MKDIIFCIIWLTILIVIAAIVLGLVNKNDVQPKVKQVHIFCWGKIPKQNLCPHCGKPSFRKFCTYCKKERGDLPFIGVYCPKCQPEGRYVSVTSDVTEICGDCGSGKVWKYTYKDWQTDPNEEGETE